MFSRIVGHQSIKEFLFGLIKNNRIGHAYLFVGPESIGKRTLSLEFFKLLSCPNAQNGEPCGKCVVCTGIDSLQLPDLHYLQPEGSARRIKIDAIREVQERLNYPPISAQYKMVLIDDAHTMTSEAANSLLKVLEEPRGNTIFILVTSLEGLLPITVRSRCTHVWFNPLNYKDIIEVLERQGHENIPTFVAKASGGSVKIATLLLQPAIWEARTELLKGLIRHTAEDVANRLSFLSNIVSNIPSEVTEIAFDLIEFVAQDLLKLSLNPEAEIYNDDLRDELLRFVNKKGAIEFATAVLDMDELKPYNISLVGRLQGLLMRV